MKPLSLLVLLAAQASCFAVDDANIVAAGDWSAPVAGSEDTNPATGRGAHHPALRGRLLLCESPKNHQLAVYVELQDCRESWGASTEIYWSGGCSLEGRDASGKPVALFPGPFSGGAPGAEWITLPCDSTVRLRISKYASFTYASTGIYFMSGEYTVHPPTDHLGLEVWQGTLKLPEMKVTPPKPPKS